MLEHQLLNLSLDSTLEFDFLFVKLGIKSSKGDSSQVDSCLSKEGYSTIELRDFIVEFRRKLERHTRVHSRVRGAETSARALRDFIHLSRRERKLSLARYLWTPEEVTELILGRTRLSRGRKDGRRMLHPYTDSETERTLSLLPDFEAGILRRLRGRTEIFWVTDSTSSELNSLVEYPLTTVVLVDRAAHGDDAGVVHHYVDGPQLVFDRVEKLGEGLTIGHVQSLADLQAQPATRLLDGGFVDISDGDPGAQSLQNRGRGQADSASPTGDSDDLSCYRHAS